MFEFEGQLTSWLVISMMALTASLVFYHMTRIKKPSLKVPPKTAAMIVTILICLNVAVSLTSLIPYNLRTEEALKKRPEEYKAGFNPEHENSYRIVYTIIVSILVFVQMWICYWVIKDSFARSK